MSFKSKDIYYDIPCFVNFFFSIVWHICMWLRIYIMTFDVLLIVFFNCLTYMHVVLNRRIGNICCLWWLLLDLSCNNILCSMVEFLRMGCCCKKECAKMLIWGFICYVIDELNCLMSLIFTPNLIRLFCIYWLYDSISP